MNLTNCISFRALEISNTIRSLGEQHGNWTRITIQSIVFNTPDKDFSTQRL